MAEFTRTNGGAAAIELVGRDVKFVKCALTGIHTSYTAIDSDFEKICRVLQQYCTITIAGTPAADNCMFMVEGLSVVAGTLDTAGDAAVTGTPTFTVYDGLSGTSFA